MTHEGLKLTPENKKKIDIKTKLLPSKGEE